MKGKIRVVPATIMLSIFLLAACGTKEENITEEESPAAAQRVEPLSRGPIRIITNSVGALPVVFNDSNDVQLEAARRLGIPPLTDLSSAYFFERPIVKIENNEYYKVDSLTHSVPFLVPEAAALLEEIGRNFADTLHRRGGDSHIIRVTSLLRTPESVSRLKRRNINATDSSTHQYATTFDISYARFERTDPNAAPIDPSDLKGVLAEVLFALREQGRCLVKYERKSSCFHVTVVN